MNQADDPTPPPPLQNPPPVAGAPVSVPPTLVSPPKLAATNSSSSWRKAAAMLLSLFLGLFLLGGLVSIVDDSCVLLFGSHIFTPISGIVTILTLFVAILVYGLMGLTPVMAKRVVLPVILFTGVIFLTAFPVLIYAYQLALPFDLFASFLTVALILGLVRWLQGSWKFHWQLVPDKSLGTRGFSGLNLLLFVLINLFVLLPVVAIYVAGCASLAVSHFSEGFVSLHPGGIVMQARKYTRDDGKTVVLVPMSHVAEADFYRNVAQVVSTNSVVLLEGVTDTNHLLVHKLSYQRAAKSLHLAEQHEDFTIKQGELVRADVDVSNFSSNTIVLLNLVTLIHTEGLNLHTVSTLMTFAPTPDFQQVLFSDLLLKRNEHLLQVLRARLPGADDFVIPWGAAHMAGLSKEIEKSGFHLVETHNIMAIRFGRHSTSTNTSSPSEKPEKTK